MKQKTYILHAKQDRCNERCNERICRSGASKVPGPKQNGCSDGLCRNDNGCTAWVKQLEYGWSRWQANDVASGENGWEQVSEQMMVWVTRTDRSRQEQLQANKRVMVQAMRTDRSGQEWLQVLCKGNYWGWGSLREVLTKRHYVLKIDWWRLELE